MIGNAVFYHLYYKKYTLYAVYNRVGRGNVVAVPC